MSLIFAMAAARIISKMDNITIVPNTAKASSSFSVYLVNEVSSSKKPILVCEGNDLLRTNVANPK